MNARLRNMLVAVGVATISGVTYVILRPDEGVTGADLLDAGFAEECPRIALECEGRITCEGFNRRLVTVPIPAASCDGGWPGLALRPTRRQRECFELRGTIEDSCQTIPDGGIEDDDAPLRAVADRCYCRQMDAGMCRWAGGADGGLVAMARGNIHPWPVAGVACRRAPCGEFAGELGSALPEACQ